MDNETKKRGRPKKFMPKTDRLEVRLSKEQLYWLNYVISRTGKNKTEVIADGLRTMYNLYK